MKFASLALAVSVSALPAKTSGQNVHARSLRSPTVAVVVPTSNSDTERRLGRGDSEPQGNGPCNGLCNAYDNSGCRTSNNLSKGCIRLEDALSDWECSCTFTTVITAAGSADQIDGTTGFGLGDVCKSLLTSTPPDYIKFWECLSSPEAGPVVVENWWFNPDVPLSAFVFEEDSVCGIIDGTELGSSTGFQLWEPKYKNLPLGQFTEFKAGYVVTQSTSSTTNQGYLNIYMRRSQGSTAYYDCRFDFLIPTDANEGTLTVNKDTPKGNSATFNGGNSNKCSESNTISEYLMENPDAVLGAGNAGYVELLYAFVLSSGSTNQNNEGLKTCWSEISIATTDGDDTTYVDIYEFTTLPPGVFN